MLEYILHRIEQIQREMLRPAQQEPLIIGLFKRLPPIGQPWPEDDRQKWLYAFKCNLDLLYGDGK